MNPDSGNTESRQEGESLPAYLERLRAKHKAEDPAVRARREADAKAFEAQLEAQRAELKPRTALPSHEPRIRKQHFAPQELAAGEAVERPHVKPVFDQDGKPTGEFVRIEDDKA